jgi:disulfide bond formation protein DsbB
VTITVMSRFFALLALLAGAGAVLAAAGAVSPGGPLRRLRDDLAPIALSLAWLVAATCMAGSLYFSEVAHLTPCRLCWYQRIAMYPLVVILGVAALRRDVDVRRYAIPLAAIGAAISAYHVQLERFPEQHTICSLDAPCNIAPVQELGFVTIAVMALCGFASIIALLAVAKSAPRTGHRTMDGTELPATASPQQAPRSASSPADQELV